MELLILGAITGMGYALMRQGTQPRLSPQQLETRDLTVDRPESYPFPQDPADSRVLLKQQQEISEQRWLQSKNPRSNIVSRKQAPYFSSVRKQHTNDELKQRRMEIHTGQLDSTSGWQHKKETLPMFEPVAQNVTSSGSSGNAANYDGIRKAAAVSGLQNNTLPFEQIRVGPGIGVGTDVPASDGFHSQYRVMPIDPYAYKHNTLEGRVVSGSGVTAAREVDPKVYSKGISRYYTMERRPMEKGRAAVTAQTHRSIIPRVGHQCHVDTQEYYGIAGASGHNLPSSEWDRNRSDARPGLPLTNVTGERAGIGGFTNAHYDPAKFTAQQREKSTALTNVTGYGYAPQAPNSFVAPPTQRALTEQGYTGGAGSIVPTGTALPGDVPQPTIREQLHDHSNGFAAAAPIIRGATVQCTDKQLLKKAKRDSQVVNTYVTLPDRIDEFRRSKIGDDLMAERTILPSMALRAVAPDNRIISHAQASSMYQNQAAPGVSSTANRIRLPEANPYQDYSLAKRVMKGNDLAISIN